MNTWDAMHSRAKATGAMTPGSLLWARAMVVLGGVHCLGVLWLLGMGASINAQPHFPFIGYLLAGIWALIHARGWTEDDPRLVIRANTAGWDVGAVVRTLRLITWLNVPLVLAFVVGIFLS